MGAEEAGGNVCCGGRRRPAGAMNGAPCTSWASAPIGASVRGAVEAESKCGHFPENCTRPKTHSNKYKCPCLPPRPGRGRPPHASHDAAHAASEGGACASLCSGPKSSCRLLYCVTAFASRTRDGAGCPVCLAVPEGEHSEAECHCQHTITHSCEECWVAESVHPSGAKTSGEVCPRASTVPARSTSSEEPSGAHEL